MLLDERVLSSLAAQLATDDDNPWTAYRQKLHDVIDGFDDGEGFNGRLIVLLALLSFSLLAALVYVGLMLWYHHKAHKQLWAFRFVARPAPSKGWILSTNRYVTTPAAVLMSSISSLTYVALAYDAFINSASSLTMSRQAFAIVRSFLGIFLAVAGYMISVTFLQAFFIAIDAGHPGRMRVNSHVFNGVTILLGVLIVAAMLVTCSLMAVQWTKVWDVYVELDEFLRQQEASYTGDLDLAAVTRATTDTQALHRQFQEYRPYRTAVWISYVVATVIIALLDMTGLGLVFYLRKQINSMSLHLDSLDMSLDDAGNAEKHISDMSMQRLNASFLEKLEEIRRARRELIIAVCMCLIVCLDLAAWSLWTLSQSNTGDDPGSLTEMSLFLNSWIIAVVLSVCNVALVIQMVMALRTSAKYRDAVPPARHPPTRPTQLRSVSSHKSQRSIVSFRDMLARGPSS